MGIDGINQAKIHKLAQSQGQTTKTSEIKTSENIDPRMSKDSSIFVKNNGTDKTNASKSTDAIAANKPVQTNNVKINIQNNDSQKPASFGNKNFDDLSSLSDKDLASTKQELENLKNSDIPRSLENSIRAKLNKVNQEQQKRASETSGSEPVAQTRSFTPAEDNVDENYTPDASASNAQAAEKRANTAGQKIQQRSQKIKTLDKQMKLEDAKQQKDLKKQEKEIEQTQKEIEKSENQTRAVAAENDTLTAEIETLNQKVNAAEGNDNSDSGEVNDAQKQIRSNAVKINSNAGTITTNNGRSASLQSRVNSNMNRMQSRVNSYQASAQNNYSQVQQATEEKDKLLEIADTVGMIGAVTSTAGTVTKAVGGAIQKSGEKKVDSGQKNINEGLAKQKRKENAAEGKIQENKGKTEVNTGKSKIQKGNRVATVGAALETAGNAATAAAGATKTIIYAKNGDYQSAMMSGISTVMSASAAKKSYDNMKTGIKAWNDTSGKTKVDTKVDTMQLLNNGMTIASYMAEKNKQSVQTGVSQPVNIQGSQRRRIR